MTEDMPPADATAASSGVNLQRAVAAQLARALQQPLAAGLHLVATPIGNLADITLRALAVLARADVVYCEDTRHSGQLMAHFGIAQRLRPYHDHNAAAERPRILALLEDGKRVALVSDAGTPLVSDPGFKLVRAALDAGHAVTSVPGPSATLTALCCAGLPTDSFLFAGFLPPREAARRERIASLRPVEATLVLFEAPGRVEETLVDLAATLGPREAAVARELTKLHEEVIRGPLPDLARQAANANWRGEVVILVGPAAPVAIDDDAIIAQLELTLGSMSLRDASRAVADALGVAKRRVYDLGVKLQAGHDRQR